MKWILILIYEWSQFKKICQSKQTILQYWATSFPTGQWRQMKSEEKKWEKMQNLNTKIFRIRIKRERERKEIINCAHEDWEPK